MSDETRFIRVNAVWESTHDVEVPIDYVDDGSLSFVDFGDIDSHGASLVDWTVTG